MKVYKDDSIRIWAFKRGGYYILRIQEYKCWLAATRKHGKYQTAGGWVDAYEVKFDMYEPGGIGKRRANNYFKKVKRSHPNLTLIESAENAYIDQDGKRCTY